jgi:hypothetical protein
MWLDQQMWQQLKFNSSSAPHKKTTLL